MRVSPAVRGSSLTDVQVAHFSQELVSINAADIPSRVNSLFIGLFVRGQI